MKIPSLERSIFWGAWFLAFIWNALLGFMLFASLSDHSLVYHRPEDLLALVFPAIGIALLAWAIRETVLWKIYGETFFVSEASIFPWGGRLHGRISFSRPPPSSMGRHFRLRLLCQVEQNSSAGTKNRNTQTVWRDAHPVDIATDGTIPVLFSLPSEIKPRMFIATFGRTTWKLKVNELGGGIRSFAGEYTIPVGEKVSFEETEHRGKRSKS